MIEKEVTFNSGDINLAGTLCLPAEEGNFPCVLMIHGSGAVDRDENARQLKLFRVKLNVFNTIAHYLADKGIASLRYDKRGCGKSSGSFGDAGLHDLIQDGKAAYEYLAAQEYINKHLIFLLGHSEGTMISPRLALEQPDIAGLILLGVEAQKLEEALKYQARKIKEDIEQGRGLNRFIARLVWKLIRYDPVKAQPIILQKVRSTDKASFRYRGQKVNAKWLREHLDYDPLETIRDVNCPILAITGEKDIQVDPQEVFLIAEHAKGEVEYHIVPNLTHILRLDEGPPSILSYKKLLKNDMDHSILDTIYNWLQKRLHMEFR